MKASLKQLGRLFKYLAAVGAVFLLIAFVAVVFFEQRVPRPVLNFVLERLSRGAVLVKADSASFRFSHGLKIRNVRLFEKRRHHTKADEPVTPFLSASLVDLELDLRRIPWSWEYMLLGATLTDLKYPRLPEGYYVPDSIEYPGQPDFKEKNEAVEFELPEIKPFRVTLIRPDILSVTPKYVEVPSVAFTRSSMRIEQIHLQWRDADALMRLNGNVELDVEQQQVKGFVHGQTRQHNIRPMLVAIDIMNALPFMDAFTKVEPPVDAACRFDVNLRNNDLHIFLDLHPRDGLYEGVPFKKADGTVDIRVFVRDTFQNARIEVGTPEKPLDVGLRDGTKMKGTIVYENTNDVGYVVFDVESHTSLGNALAIADVMNDGTLDCLVPETAPDITLKGRLAVDPKHAAANDLRGSVAFARGTLFSVPLVDASGVFHLKGTDVTFTNVVAQAPRGGLVRGDARLSIPEFKQDHATFRVNLDCRDVTLTDLAETFKFDAGDRHGKIDANMTLTGPLSTNVVAELGGSGHVVCREGHLAQMKLFAGLTDFLARNVPGISGLVNLSRASMDYTLDKGVLTASNVRVEGDLFSLQGHGTYNLVTDDLDFTVRLAFTQNESVLGKITLPINWSVGLLSKALFDFRLQGKIDKPAWTYNKNLMDRLK